jgi:hypothetical protein
MAASASFGLMCLVGGAAVSRAAGAAFLIAALYVPGKKGLVLLARLSAFYRAMWTIRRFGAVLGVKCRVFYFL